MRINGTVWSARDIAAHIDHTVLAPDATRKDMENACALARAYGQTHIDAHGKSLFSQQKAVSRSKKNNRCQYSQKTRSRKNQTLHCQSLPFLDITSQKDLKMILFLQPDISRADYTYRKRKSNAADLYITGNLRRLTPA